MTPSSALARRWRINRRGGLAARASRWRILHWMLLQKLGFNRWVCAPLFFGEKMWVLTGETVSRGLLGFGYAEAALTALMIETIKPGMRVGRLRIGRPGELEVGHANVGFAPRSRPEFGFLLQP